jgi:CDP-diacylglycerol--inositol 3-phosphatidyltransferase
MICDLFDGMAARKFNQSSTFGAVLDMVTDRFSNAVLLGVLYGLYPTIGPVFLVMITLDLASHWY